MRGNSSHAALTTKIDIHNKDGQKVGEKEVVTYAGVLALAHDDGLRSIRTTLVQISFDQATSYMACCYLDRLCKRPAYAR
jgi:hypothetical protein